jgi:peptidylprolyl isomerase
MGKTLTIIIIIAIAAIGGWFLFTNSAAENNMENSQISGNNPIVVLNTNIGAVEIELFTDKTPITAGNFLKLAREGFYDGTKFHRVIAGFMIQGGDPLSKGNNTELYGTGGPGYAIKDEFSTGLSNIRGTISMANAGPNTGGSQFFINLLDNIYLDGKHAVFGKVIFGMNVVDKIAAVQTGERNIPLERVVVESVSINRKP